MFIHQTYIFAKGLLWAFQRLGVDAGFLFLPDQSIALAEMVGHAGGGSLDVVTAWTVVVAQPWLWVIPAPIFTLVQGKV